MASAFDSSSIKFDLRKLMLLLVHFLASGQTQTLSQHRSNGVWVVSFSVLKTATANNLKQAQTR